VLEPLPPLLPGLPFTRAAALRIGARYGAAGLAAVCAMPRTDHCPAPGGATLWGELRWCARAEGVRHLDDLLLRRVRLGLTRRCGGAMLFPRLRRVLGEELGWDATRCRDEEQRYLAHWWEAHGVPR